MAQTLTLHCLLNDLWEIKFSIDYYATVHSYRFAFLLLFFTFRERKMITSVAKWFTVQFNEIAI